MKHVVLVVRFIVGGLFIFSGLIKINDPVGTAIKMEEYFEIFAMKFASFFHYFVPLALPIAVFMVVLEVILGIALLINYKQNLTLNLLLVIILIFTFLTGYSAITNSVTDCGCFGDAIKFTPWQSFGKDIILLILIVVLLLYQHTPQDKKAEKISHFVVGGSLVWSLGLAIYAIAHLPFIDFRAYKISNHIPTEMKPSAPYIFEYIMEKEGKLYTFDAYPADTTYKYKAMNHLNTEASPKIIDFAVWNDSGDYTADMFVGVKLFVILHDVTKANIDHLSAITNMVDALGTQIEIIALTASDGKIFELFKLKHGLDLPYYYTDATVLKTIARANPSLWLLKNGTVKGKWHINDVPVADEILGLVE